jgi:hypothetical protein
MFAVIVDQVIGPPFDLAIEDASRPQDHNLRRPSVPVTPAEQFAAEKERFERSLPDGGAGFLEEPGFVGKVGHAALAQINAVMGIAFGAGHGDVVAGTKFREGARFQSMRG